MAKKGKQYSQAEKARDKSKSYSPEEAIELAKQVSYVKFDESLEMHLRTGLDPRNAEQQMRGIALLPHGLGKPVRILVFAQGEAVRIAEEAGADYVGADDLVKKIEEGWLDFDVSIATPDMMSKVSKLGKILGRRGLMPNPKAGTVVQQGDIPRVIQDARKGRVEFRLDRTANIHVTLGKVSFESQKLLENMAAVIEAITKARPSGAKGQYIKNISLATSMGPGFKLDLRSTLAMKIG
ncbi:MAG: 50S ribosomal protein L1 [Chloroflexota bacterium]|nr:50S ribosomal protein L1 [Chloroflexota bacterium]